MERSEGDTVSDPVGSPPLVDFPTTDPRLVPPTHTPEARVKSPQHLPFRRISFPTPPALLNRQSIASVASYDSFPEEGPLPTSSAMALIGKSPAKGSKYRPSPIEAGRRNGRRRELRQVDEQREAKRRNIIDEFHETERTYVEGLELVYSHFLTPIIASLDTPSPLLDRTELTSVFSNFIDIWNLHRSFYSSLTTYLQSSSPSNNINSPPPLSPILLSHFPYLSLYSPFITAFPNLIASLSSLLSSNPAFASFVSKQEADPRCGKLKLRDWLLTIVQRCPRYLLLLKDLIQCTDPDDREYDALTKVHALVSKITVSLNTSLHTHAQILSLLALQRSTANLPFQLIAAGRTFIKRAPLLHLEGSTPREREFLLFSDCLIWLANVDKGDDIDQAYSWDLLRGYDGVPRPRCKSDAALLSPALRTPTGEQSSVIKRKESLLKLLSGSPSKKKARNASSGTEDRWSYKGHLALVDLEVVVPPFVEHGDDHRFEILSPQNSFAVYAATEDERDEWVSEIRSAKASLMISLNVIHPNTTLTSSSSTHHLRRALQALPYSPDEQELKPRRGRVEHFVPAIWIPDGKTDSCMRCGRTFGWRRRRHHCRLCGRCVCSGCSGKTFYVLDPSSKSSHKASRSCNACYDTVFPLIEPTPPSYPTTTATISPLTLSGLKSMPSLVLGEGNNNINSPSVLMALESSPKRSSHRLDESSPSRLRRDSKERERELSDDGPVPAIRIKPPIRPRSYVQILEDFNEHHALSPAGMGPGGGDDEAVLGSGSSCASGNAARYSNGRLGGSSFVLDEREEDEGGDEVEIRGSGGGGDSGGGDVIDQKQRRERQGEDLLLSRFGEMKSGDGPGAVGGVVLVGRRVSRDGGGSWSLPSSPRKKEDTARRHKRFSVPAVAIQTTPVTTRPNVIGEGKAKRISLVLGRFAGVVGHHSHSDFGHGVAAGKLSELLKRNSGQVSRA